jgi:arsenate reductase (thioredoxin)
MTATPTTKQRVLILCTANSARSQIAEGLLRHLAGDRYHVFSAGARATRVNPMAITVMDELGIDIREQTSKSMTQFVGQPFDAVITVCDDAAASCPFLAGDYNRVHWGLPDPGAVKDEAARLKSFRFVRDQLMKKFKRWLA